MIGSRIRQIREDLSLTQARFAEKIGVDYQSLSKWERNLVVPTANYLIKIASLGNVTTDWLLTGKEPKFKTKPRFDSATAELINYIQTNPKAKKAFIYVMKAHGGSKEIFESIQRLNPEQLKLLQGLLKEMG